MKTCSILSLLALSACGSGKIPSWDGHLFVGDSGNDAITRAQSHEQVKCADPAMDNYVCMSLADFKTFYATYVQGCKQWKDGTALETLDSMAKKHKDAVKRALEIDP